MKAPPLRGLVPALLALTIAACGIAIPDDLPVRGPTTTSTNMTPGGETNTADIGAATNAVPLTVDVGDHLTQQAVDLESLLAQPDKLVTDIDTTLEGVPQP